MICNLKTELIIITDDVLKLVKFIDDNKLHSENIESIFVKDMVLKLLKSKYVKLLHP